MSGAFGRRTVFDDPFVVPDQTVAPIEFEPIFEPSTDLNLVSSQEHRNIEFGSIAVEQEDSSIERITLAADNSQFSTAS